MRWVGLSVVVSLVAACSPGLPTATPMDAERAHVELADLQQGRSLTIAKCSSCHHVPLPTDRSAEQWPRMIDEMSVRSHLDETQHHLIEAYLVTMANQPPVTSAGK
jgi:cytochrome c553